MEKEKTNAEIRARFWSALVGGKYSILLLDEKRTRVCQQFCFLFDTFASVFAVRVCPGQGGMRF